MKFASQYWAIKYSDDNGGGPVLFRKTATHIYAGNPPLPSVLCVYTTKELAEAAVKEKYERQYNNVEIVALSGGEVERHARGANGSIEINDEPMHADD